MDAAVTAEPGTAAKRCDTLLIGEKSERLTFLKEKYQEKMAALEEARQLTLRERSELVEEHQATLEERDHLLIMVSELDGELESAQTLQSQSWKHH